MKYKNLTFNLNNIRNFLLEFKLSVIKNIMFYLFGIIKIKE